MRRTMHLNFDWQYSPNFSDEYINNDCDMDDFTAVNIPHSNVELPYNNFDERAYQFESCYKKSIDIPRDMEDKQLILHFDGVMTYAEVYLNGEFVIEHKGGYTPFTADITDYAVYGRENVICVYVDSTERVEIPPFGFVIDYLTYGGIYREVRLEVTNKIFIENCHVKTGDVLSGKPYVEADVFINNIAKAGGKAKIIASIIKDDKEVLGFNKEVSLPNDTKITLKSDAAGFELWDIDNPVLYDLKVTIEIDGKAADEQIYRFGFREANFTPQGFYLNGKKIKLRGLNRHQSYPYVGYAMPKSAQYKDAEILKYDLGVNIVRLSHYPQSKHFLDRCDEIGLLVFDEIPGWQHIGEKGEWWDIALQNTREMIQTDWNRPSIIVWGTRVNESEDCDELYTSTNKIAKELDDTRQTSGVRCIGGSNLIEDVYAYNDFVYAGDKPVLDKRKNIVKGIVPYIVTEYNGHMFPTKKFDSEQKRIDHALRHMQVMEAMYKDDEISGAIGWCMADYNTHKDFGSGDKICYHGVLDMFRIEKYAASAYASQQNDKPVMTIAHSMENGDMDSSTRGDVYAFTNCDYIKLYVNDRYVEKFYPNKKMAPSVPNAPIFIDDFLGDIIEKNEIFNKKDAKRIKTLLQKADKVGEHLPLPDKIKMGLLFMKYKINMKDGRDLYSKYFGGWGSASTSYKFEGYIDDKCMITKIKSQVFEPSLQVEVDELELVEDITYDVTRIIVRLKNEYGDDLLYGSAPIVVETDDKLELIGPNVLSLIGGSIGFWVKTVGKTGQAAVTIKSQRFGEIKRTLLVKKA